MTLTQLRYLIQIVESGSMNRAAQALFVSQPSLSKAIAELEAEMGITIFYRTNRGVTLSEEGTRFLSYARQVLEQADLLERQYKGGRAPRRVFAISSQHYAFVVNAFVELVREYGGTDGGDRYEFSLLEGRTHDIVEDVRTQRSELGIVYLSHFNHDVMLSIFDSADLDFDALFEARPHVFVSRDNPLASRSSVTFEDLAPYPRLSYDQGVENSFYFSEELHAERPTPKRIVVSDRATLFNLLIGLDGYTISSGILSSDLNGDGIVSVPLVSDEVMRLGCVHPHGRPLSPIARRYLEVLRDYVRRYRDGEA